jgi:hypothetical protein
LTRCPVAAASALATASPPARPRSASCSATTRAATSDAVSPASAVSPTSPIRRSRSASVRRSSATKAPPSGVRSTENPLGLIETWIVRSRLAAAVAAPWRKAGCSVPYSRQIDHVLSSSTRNRVGVSTAAAAGAGAGADVVACTTTLIGRRPWDRPDFRPARCLIDLCGGPVKRNGARYRTFRAAAPAGELT